MAHTNVALNGLGGTYIGTSATNMLLEPMFHSDEIMRNYTVYPNVKFRKNLMLAPSLTAGITAVNEGCGDNTCDPAGFTLEPKYIQVTNTSVKQVQCWEEFFDEVIVESYKDGINMPDLTGTHLADVIISRVRDGIKSDLIRNMWAGDSGAAGAGFCSYLSMGNGLWELFSVGGAINGTQLVEFTGSLAGAAATAAYTVVGGAIPSADALGALELAFDGAPAALQQVPAREKRMFVTPNIYNAYYGSLTAVSPAVGAVDYGHSEAQTGVNYPRLHFRGIEVLPMYEWDLALTDLVGGNLPPLFTAAGATTTGQTTNGVIYAAKSNLFIGSDVNNPDAQLKMFYDEVGDNMHIRSYFTMGFQYGWDSLVNGVTIVD